MELSELRKKPHLSASAVSDYLDCSLLYKFGRIDKIRPPFTPDALEFGSAVHLVMAEINEHKMVGTHLSLNEIQDSFERNWTKLAKDKKDLKYSTGKSFDILMLEGKELLGAYYHKRANDAFNVIGVEEAFSINLKGCPVPVIGAIDLLEEDSSGTIIITDYKTSAKAYSIDEVDRNFQLTLYQIAVKQRGFANREILLKFDCLIKTKVPKFETYYTTRNENDERRAIRKIIEVHRGISKGVFIPNDSTSNWKCKNCSFKSNCDQWFMEDAA